MTRANAAAGARDRQVTIQQLTESVGGSGFPIESWTTLAVVWANKVSIPASAFTGERFTANQVSAPFDTRWTLPYSAEMNPDLVDVMKTRRLLVEGRVHDIVGAAEIGRREGIELITLSGGLIS